MIQDTAESSFRRLDSAASSIDDAVHASFTTKHSIHGELFYFIASRFHDFFRMHEQVNECRALNRDT